MNTKSRADLDTKQGQTKKSKGHRQRDEQRTKKATENEDAIDEDKVEKRGQTNEDRARGHRQRRRQTARNSGQRRRPRTARDENKVEGGRRRGWTQSRDRQTKLEQGAESRTDADGAGNKART